MRRRLLRKTTALATVVVAASLLGGLVLDSAADDDPRAPEGRWRIALPRGRAAAEELTEDQLREIDRLRSIGYVTGSRPAPPATGVTVHDRERAQQGLNFYTSGHFPGAVLMDMEGNVLHMWERHFSDIWPKRRDARGAENAKYWRYAHLFENGDVLAIFEGFGMVKLDKDSNVLWSSYHHQHHDLKVTEDGRIFTLTREAVIHPQINPDEPILEDYFTVFDADGNFLSSMSIVDALGESQFLHQLEGMNARGDIFHTNAIEILDGSLADDIPAFRAGSLLLSARTISMLMVLDPENRLITWTSKGPWVKQHDPSVLENGRIILFDNNGNDGRSRVIEFDPVTNDIIWQYRGATPDDFYSQMCGAVTRLRNGNTLATESDGGRAIEIAPDGTVVWEYLNPERAGDEVQFVATLFEMMRMPEDFPMGWVYDE